MKRAALVAGWALMVGACSSTNQERVRDYNQVGMDFFQRGDFVHARDSFQAALALQPGDANLVYNMGQCSEKAGQYTRAEKDYQQCLQIAPNHPECRFALASLLIRENRRPEAVQMVETWLTRQPQLAGPYAIDGWMWRQMGDLPRAQSRLQQALAIQPDNRLALNEMGQVYEALNRPDRAYILYEHCLEIDPEQPEVRARLTSLKKQGTTRPRPD